MCLYKETLAGLFVCKCIDAVPSYYVAVPSYRQTLPIFMNTRTHSLRALLVLALMIVPLLPVSAAPVEAASYRSTRTYSSQNYSRERYSSAIQKEIRKLDKDEVENLPIPILLGLLRNQITSDFGDPRGDGTRSHEGQDLIAPRGSLIASPTDAVVTRTGTGESSGIYVYTANPGGETFVYMHLDRIADGVKAGTVLEPGDLIGYVGNTGNASGGVTHLHFEIRDGRTPIDPYPRLTKEFTLEQRITALKALLAELIKQQKKS